MGKLSSEINEFNSQQKEKVGPKRFIFISEKIQIIFVSIVIEVLTIYSMFYFLSDSISYSLNGGKKAKIIVKFLNVIVVTVYI